MRKDREDQISEHPIGERTIVAPFDLPARRLDERRVLHARGARGDARHASEARVEMADERRRHRSPFVQRRLHQVNASARRVHLLAPQRIRRTRWQAEAAMHARVDERTRRRIVSVECVTVQLKIPCGSKARWSDRVSSGTALRTPQRSLSASAPRSTTMLPIAPDAWSCSTPPACAPSSPPIRISPPPTPPPPATSAPPVAHPSPHASPFIPLTP